MTFTGSQGNPAFKINGGSEVTSGTITNSQTLTLVMDSPASLNQSNKMQITLGTGPAVSWRVWTGDSVTPLKKRIFVTSTTYNSNLGGTSGADSKCQTQADTNPNLVGKTWKALISSPTDQENDWAINRIGYNWNELWPFNANGSFKDRVVTASNLWSNNPIENPVMISETGSLITSLFEVHTGTQANGLSGDALNCQNWTFQNGSVIPIGNSLVTSTHWLDTQATNTTCNGSRHLYCVEQ